MKILHLSSTTLSGAPYRLSQVYNKYSGHESRHICWTDIIYNRVFPCDLVGSAMSKDELKHWLDWADVLHFHNRWKRQEIFKDVSMPDKPSVIQIHSPREEEGHHEEVASGVPLAIIAQYHVRQWPELEFIIPNVVDIYDGIHQPPKEKLKKVLPLISYAPSSPCGRGWNRKSYPTVSPILKRMFFGRKIFYDRLVGLPYLECMKKKQQADIGIDEISTGSYHMSSLEYLSMGVCTIGRLDEQTEKVLKDLTGAQTLPWTQTTEGKFKHLIVELVNNPEMVKHHGNEARLWMEKYWDPKVLCSHFTNMYERL